MVGADSAVRAGLKQARCLAGAAICTQDTVNMSSAWEGWRANFHEGHSRCMGLQALRRVEAGGDPAALQRAVHRLTAEIAELRGGKFQAALELTSGGAPPNSPLAAPLPPDWRCRLQQLSTRTGNSLAQHSWFWHKGGSAVAELAASKEAGARLAAEMVTMEARDFEARERMEGACREAERLREQANLHPRSSSCSIANIEMINVTFKVPS